MLLADFLRDCRERLTSLYPRQEAGNIARLLCMERLGIRSYSLVTDSSLEIPPEKCLQLSADMQRLLNAEPLQYVLGKAPFFGRDFLVGPGALIPRPETELLVEKALERPFSRALDLCTGSGCIAWTLALERPRAEVCAVDVSKDALATARRQPFDARISFLEADVLRGPCIEGEFDLIVSNPPYIMDRERALMQRNVLEYEPEIALFVPDEDPLLFCRAVGDWCSKLLSQKGRAIIEINENLGKASAEVFEIAQFSNVSILKDLSGRDRFVYFDR